MRIVTSLSRKGVSICTLSAAPLLNYNELYNELQSWYSQRTVGTLFPTLQSSLRSILSITITPDQLYFRFSPLQLKGEWHTQPTTELAITASSLPDRNISVAV